MRLSASERRAIEDIFNSYSPAEGTQLLLYGSRAQDDRRGGDIDLVIVVENEAEKTRLLAKRIEILVHLDEKIGEQRIDLSFITRKEAKEDSFYKTALVNSVCLKSW